MEIKTEQLCQAFIASRVSRKKDFLADSMSAYEGALSKFNRPKDNVDAAKDAADSLCSREDVAEALALVLSTAKDPVVAAADVEEAYKALNESGFRISSLYELDAAMYIAHKGATDDTYTRFEQLFTGMKRSRFAVTKVNEYVHAAVLAMREDDVEELLKKRKDALAHLDTKTLGKANAEDLADLIPLGDEDARTLAARCNVLARTMQGLKSNYRKDRCPMYLGLCTFFEEDPNVILERCAEIEQRLKEAMPKKGLIIRRSQVSPLTVALLTAYSFVPENLMTALYAVSLAHVFITIELIESSDII